MSQIAPLLKTLKQELRAQGLTYADAASALGISESSVKRLFSASRLSLDRLEQLCQVAGMEISDLVQKMSEARRRVQMLSEEQEQEIAADKRLLLIAICALNRVSFEEILQTYEISEPECIQLLARLDRLKLLELLPLNRYRLVVAKDFRWIPDGPIQRFFRREVQPAFLRSKFNGAGESLIFHSGMLSRASNATLLKKMDKLAADFHELNEQDQGLPLEERFGSSLMIALRPWEFSYFGELRREAGGKKFAG